MPRLYFRSNSGFDKARQVLEEERGVEDPSAAARSRAASSGQEPTQPAASGAILQVIPASDSDLEARTAKPQPNAMGPEESGAEGHKKLGCNTRIIWDILQQKETSILLPLWFHHPKTQVVAAGISAVLFILMGSGLLSVSSGIVEVTPIGYRHGDVEKEFTVDTQIDSDVLVYYDMPGLLSNRKQLVENKDPDIMYTMMSKVKCVDAEDQAAFWRRSCLVDKRAAEGGPLECPSDQPFADVINELGITDAFKPCGLMALSVFLDEYRFAKMERDGDWGWINVSEANIALPHEVGSDSTVYGSVIEPDGQGGFTIGEEKTKSWLQSGPFFEHFKVWYRPPAAPHVRNLWGRIKGPLAAGKYKVHFRKNSAIWTTDWGLPEKRVVLAGEHTLGSRGSTRTLGILSLFLGAVEAIMIFVFLALVFFKAA